MRNAGDLSRHVRVIGRRDIRQNLSIDGTPPTYVSY